MKWEWSPTEHALLVSKEAIEDMESRSSRKRSLGKKQSNSLKDSEPLKKRTLLNWADMRK